ncbi:MAG TPA: response regulator transcription factor [Terriglobales bacterium]|nr:response regulator transcription factor [Terriglobales bacterium]
MPKVSVLLADNNSAVLDRVAKLLRADYNVVGAVKDGAAVLAESLRLNPDIIVLDISMGELSGIDVARRLRDSGCNSKIIFLTVHEDADFVNAAMGVGAAAYVVKSRLSLDLITAIHAVLTNKLFVSPNLLYVQEEKGG